MKITLLSWRRDVTLQILTRRYKPLQAVSVTLPRRYCELKRERERYEFMITVTVTVTSRSRRDNGKSVTSRLRSLYDGG